TQRPPAPTLFPYTTLFRSNIPYGSNIKVKNGQKISKGDVICTWDPFNAVILSEVSGTVHFENVIEGVTYREEADEQTGHREKVRSEEHTSELQSRENLVCR